MERELHGWGGSHRAGARGNTYEPPKACSSRSLQEGSTLPTHMVPELTLEAFSLSEVPAQGKATRLLLTNVKLFIHMPPHAICPLHHPCKGKLEEVPGQIAQGKQREQRGDCLHESCQHCLLDCPWLPWFPCFLKHP